MSRRKKWWQLLQVLLILLSVSSSAVLSWRARAFENVSLSSARLATNVMTTSFASSLSTGGSGRFLTRSMPDRSVAAGVIIDVKSGWPSLDCSAE